MGSRPANRGLESHGRGGRGWAPAPVTRPLRIETRKQGTSVSRRGVGGVQAVVSGEAALAPRGVLCWRGVTGQAPKEIAVSSSVVRPERHREGPPLLTWIIPDEVGPSGRLGHWALLHWPCRLQPPADIGRPSSHEPTWSPVQPPGCRRWYPRPGAARVLQPRLTVGVQRTRVSVQCGF